VLAAFGPLVFAQGPATDQVTIKVTDQTSAPIPNARIRVVPGPDHPPAPMETGATGELALQLKPGGYALFTSAQGFKSDIRHIEIRTSPAGTVVPLVLKVMSGGGPVVVVSEEEARKQAQSLFLYAMPYRGDWQITQKEFAAMPQTRVEIRNLETGATERYGGVRISDLLTLAGAPMDDASIDIATRSYLKANEAVFSLAELAPGLHEGEILVADSLNGLPLDSAHGPFMLVVSADRRRIRWVRNLRRIVLYP